MKSVKKSWIILSMLLTLFLLTLTCGGNLAYAKGPVPTTPPVSIYLYTLNNQEIRLTQAQVTAIGILIQSVPHLYNSSFKLAILDLASRSSQMLAGKWIDHIRLTIEQATNGTYALTVYFGTVSNGSDTETVQRSYAADKSLAPILANLNAGLGIDFSVTGSYLGTQQGTGGSDEFFFFIDPYFHHFGSISSQIAQSLAGQLGGGKGFSWLSIFLIDENVVRIDSSTQNATTISTSYFGTGSNGTTRTVTLTSSASSTATETTTLTKTQAVQTTTVTTTITASSPRSDSGGATISSYGGYAVSGIIIALVVSIVVVAISRKSKP